MKLTKRGERVFKTLLVVAIVAMVWGYMYALNHIWWQGEGYCWGTYAKCIGVGL